MKEIQIRQAVIEDLEQVAAVEARCFPAAEGCMRFFSGRV